MVDHTHVRRLDYCRATLRGSNAWDEVDPPLSLEQLQKEYPELATRAGLPRVRVLDL